MLQKKFFIFTLALLVGLTLSVGCSDDSSEDSTPAVTHPWSDFPAETLASNLWSLWQMDAAGMEPADDPFTGVCDPCPDPVPEGESCIDDMSSMGSTYLHFEAEGNFTSMMNLDMTEPMAFSTNGWITCPSYGGTYTYDDATKKVVMTSDEGGTSEMFVTGGGTTGGVYSTVTGCANISPVVTAPADTEVIREDCGTYGLIMTMLK